MEINKINYYFKERDAVDVACQIRAIDKDLAYKELDKGKVFLAYKIDEAGECKLENITEKVKAVHGQKCDIINEIYSQLQQKWEQCKDDYFNILEKDLNIKVDRSEISNYYAFLHLVPIDEINIESNSIYLNCDKSIDEIFQTFIIMLTKLIVVKVWKNSNKWVVDTTYSAQNKLWLFVEIAIDAIFANSGLNKFCDSPTYKYFYSIKIDGVNIMEQFRKLYGKISLLDFLDTVYMFVRENYKIILKFKNYLY